VIIADLQEHGRADQTIEISTVGLFAVLKTGYNTRMPNGDVQFDTDKYRMPRYKAEPPKVVQWVLKYSGGLVKDQRQAQYVLLGFAALAIIISLVLFFGGGGGPNIPLPPGAKIIYSPGEPPRLEKPLTPLR